MIFSRLRPKKEFLSIFLLENTIFRFFKAKKTTENITQKNVFSYVFSFSESNIKFFFVKPGKFVLRLPKFESESKMTQKTLFLC